MNVGPNIICTEDGLGLITEDGENYIVTDTGYVVPSAELTTIIPSYAYQQYSDDANIVAFFTAFNVLAQTYLDWFNQTPLAIYTNASINGPLLDWIGQGIYGISRPVFSTLETIYTPNALNALPLNTMAINGSTSMETGTAVLANDDYYKRTLTWHVYIGDGRATNATIIRKRIARFLFGTNGTDITLSQAQAIQVEVETSPVSYSITIPAGTSSSYFQQAFEAGILAWPFQLSASVTIA